MTYRPRARRSPRWQRALLSVALVTCLFATFFSASNLLSRAWPALFPGQSLPALSLPRAVRDLPVIERAPLPSITSPNDNSAFHRTRYYLVLGLDRRPGSQEIDSYLTDVIMVAAVNPVDKTASLLSFPRDLLVTIHEPNGNTHENRINESFGVGVERGGTIKAGAEQVMLDMRENFGIELDNWIILDFMGVETMIDGIGGIDIDVPAELSVPDWWYSDDDLNAQWVAIPPGEQHLDGYHAVAFGRYREDSDLKRVKRQQLVVTRALATLTASDLLSDPGGLWDSYKDTITTDLSTVEVLGLAPLAQQSVSSLRTYSVADPVNGRESVFDHVTEYGAAVLLWDEPNVQYWISQALTGPKYAASDVEVVNALGATGMDQSSALARYLVHKGLPTVYLGPDREPEAHTHIVVYDSEAREMAADIAEWMELPESAVEISAEAGMGQPDVVVIVGEDFHLPGG